MAETYKEILAGLDPAPCQNSEFIELNKYAMCALFGRRIYQSMAFSLSPEDYEVFWGCMKIYDAYKVNYYIYYLKLITGVYGDFSVGLSEWTLNTGVWLTGRTSVSLYEEHLEEVCKYMRFFGFTHYDKLSLSTLEKMLEDVPAQKKALHEEELENRGKQYQLAMEKKVFNYFNFGDFSETKFAKFVEACTLKQKHGGDISIDEAISLAQKAPEQTYIVTLSRNGNVVFAGTTSKLFSYLGKYSKIYEADSASFEAVDKAYAKDVLLATMIFFDLPLDKFKFSSENRRYTTLKTACFVYRREEEITRKEVLTVIDICKLRLIEAGDEIILDKIALDRALH